MPKKSSGDNRTSVAKGPGYIIGLPTDDPEAPIAQTKFEHVVERLQRAYPELREARATVKTVAGKGDRKQYQVEVFIFTGKDRVTFLEEGWELGAIFDGITDRLKRMMTKAESKPAYQRRPTRGERESSNPEELGLGG